MDANITAQIQTFFNGMSKDSQHKETCVMCMEAGYHSNWIKLPRYITVVKRKEWHALAIVSARKLANNTLMDIAVETIIPIDKQFACDYENSIKPIGGGVLTKVTSGKTKFVFEFENSNKARQFWLSLSQVTDRVDEQHELFSEYSWLTKYKVMGKKNFIMTDDEKPSQKSPVDSDPDLQAAFKNDPNDPFNTPPPNGGLKSSRHSLPDMDPKRSLRAPRVKSHQMGKSSKSQQFRESEQSIRLLVEDLRNSPSDDQKYMYVKMQRRENEYTEVDTRTVFVGTWNVNGKVADMPLSDWLLPDKDGPTPDIYAIGFQEMDLNLSNVALNKSTPNAIEDKWLKLIEISLPEGVTYRRLERSRLAGIFIVVYCKASVRDNIGDVAASSVATGMFNVMGNKGAVGIRFRWHSSTFCFICCHLAAGESEQDLDSRNRDYRYIAGRMAFGVDRNTVGIDSHDLIYFFGDLNYRIVLDVNTVKDLIKTKDFAKLHDYDELFRQLMSKKILLQYEEGPLNFPPSYKFDINTDVYDTSDKNRIPSYCDRILWRGTNCRTNLYTSIASLRISDHKPVAAVFNIGVKRIVPHLARRTYEAVIRQMDVMHNLTLPKASLSSHSVDFGQVRFMEPKQGITTLRNDGQSGFEFTFKPCPAGPDGRERLFPPWLTVEPQRGTLGANETMELNFEVYINSVTVADFNMGREKIVEGTLILSLEGGRDLFITCEGIYRPSSFGLPIQRLIRMREAAASYDQDTIIRLCKSPVEEASQERTSEKDRQPFCFIKELWRLCNHIEKFGLEESGLFQRPGLHSEIMSICDSLDTTPACQSKNPLPPCSIHSVTETILLFLTSMPETIIPPAFNERLIRASKLTINEAGQVIKSMPKENRDVFHYLILFMKRVLEFRKKNETNSLVLASIFVEVLTKDIPSERRPEKIGFLQMFLESDIKDLGY